MIEPTIESLLAAAPANGDRALAAHAAPLLCFDTREPFLPAAAGYTVFRASGPSPSFPRQILLGENAHTPATQAVEYAIWWDWDIGHLYELEHVWVYLDDAGQVVNAEASWHGGYHTMRSGEAIPLQDGHVRLLAEPGKHALAPAEDWFEVRRAETRVECLQPGRGGVWITPLFEAAIHSKSPAADRDVQAYLARFAFEPTYQFAQTFQIGPEHLVPWPYLCEWIPRRVAWWVERLHAERAG